VCREHRRGEISFLRRSIFHRNEIYQAPNFLRGAKILSRVTVNQHFLEQYLRLDSNRKTPPMQPTLANLEINILEKMYLAEMETLKLKLLTGAFWKDIKRQKDKTLELAHTIHEKQFGNLALSLG
jgi:hypothetical protein